MTILGNIKVDGISKDIGNIIFKIISHYGVMENQ